MTKKQRVLAVIERLKKEYPEASCTLAYEDAWQLLVSVRLAAQCTDARVDQITPLLYEKFPSVAALAAADPSEIEAIVRPCGLGPSKARDISKCMRVLHEQYDDQVPTTFEELLALPGVGRKSANLVMGDVFGKPAIAFVPIRLAFFVSSALVLNDEGTITGKKRRSPIRERVAWLFDVVIRAHVAKRRRWRRFVRVALGAVGFAKLVAHVKAAMCGQ